MFSLILILALLMILSLLLHVYYKSSVLKDIPGPFLTRYTKLPLLYQTLGLNRTRYIHELHKRYGTLVRLAPDEVSINDPPSVGPIYNFEKTHFYNVFEAFSTKNMVSTPGWKEHGRKRKNLGAEYTKSYILRPENLSVIYDRTRQMIDSIPPETNVDVFFLFNYMAQDIISGFFFGDKYGSHLLEGEDTSVFNAWHKRRHTFHWLAELPNFTNFIYSSNLAKLMPLWHSAALGEQHINDMMLKWMARCDPDKAHLYTKLLKTGMSEADIAAEIVDHLGAGHETTGTTLTFMVDHLSKNQEQQAKLHEELRDIDLDDFNKVDKLPYLNGVVFETLRLYSAAPASEPRIVPEGGVTLCSKFIPAATVVSAQPYSMHRHEDYFSNALEFQPERWLDPNVKSKTAWMAFGKGTRGCIGQNIAVVTIKVVIGHLFKRFHARKPQVLPEREDMDFKDYYMISPKNDTCSIIFEII